MQASFSALDLQYPIRCWYRLDLIQGSSTVGQLSRAARQFRIQKLYIPCMLYRMQCTPYVKPIRASFLQPRVFTTASTCPYWLLVLTPLALEVPEPPTGGT